MKMPRQSFLVAKHEHENLSKQSAGLCQEEVAPLTPTYPTPSYHFPAPSTVTQRTAVGTKLCDMCISGAPRCVCVMWARGEANFKIYAQVAGQLTNKHINQFIDGARDEHTRSPTQVVCLCVCVCVCVCVLSQLQGAIIEFRINNKGELNKTFCSCICIVYTHAYRYTCIYSIYIYISGRITVIVHTYMQEYIVYLRLWVKAVAIREQARVYSKRGLSPFTSSLRRRAVIKLNLAGIVLETYQLDFVVCLKLIIQKESIYNYIYLIEY